MNALDLRQKIVLSFAAVLTALTAILHYSHANETLIFIVSACALAGLAATVSDAVEQLGARVNPGATGVLQSALGNLPELMIGIFALHDGLVSFVQASLVGSVLANQLLVLGLAFLFGGLKHGRQRFHQESPRVIATLMVLAVSALLIPSLAALLHAPVAGHENELSITSSIILLIVFAASVPHSISGQLISEAEEGNAQWSTSFTVTVLALAGVASAFVSDWFVEALTPAIHALHISETFTGLVIVAIAGNAVENWAGVQLMRKNKADVAVSIILNSPLQIALALIPALVLISFAFGLPHLTLVFAPLLVASLAISTIITTIVVDDGESIWLEGVALIGVYAILAACFWWN